jgi:predicted O-methyltransferase YrrM
VNRKAIADYLAAAVIGVGAPLFRAVGSQPGSYPRYMRQADRSGVHLRSTHYYQPVYSERDLPAVTDGERDLPGLDLREGEQLALLESFCFQQELAQFLYAYGDAESLYCMLRRSRPRRMIEIGSGYSTRVARVALARNAAEDGSPPCRHLCIEPFPSEQLDQLGAEVLAREVQDVDFEHFASLQAGDVLFIDSSHVIRPYGDVLFEYQRIIPALAKGVLVHVHDIFTPRDYPEKWLRGERRLWNEQYLLETMLTHSPRYQVRLALNWLKHNHHRAFARAFPRAASSPNHQPGAFWFEIAH